MVWASVTLSGSGVENNDVVQECHHFLSVPQPRLCLDKGLVLSQCKEHGHEGVALPPRTIAQ